MDAPDKPQTPAYLIVGKIITWAMYIWVIFGIIVLGIRVFLLAFSASSGAPFANFIYSTSTRFLQPFRGIFPPRPIGETGYLDVAALFAMIMYGLLGWGFAALIHYIQNKIDAYAALNAAAARRRREALLAQRQASLHGHNPATPASHANHIHPPQVQ
jgi:uncharacterized protein YggT (Ycf19 family)